MKNKLNEIEVVYNKTIYSEQNINSPSVAIKMIRDIMPVNINHRECAGALYLDRSNNVIGFYILSIGGVAGTVIDGKIVFQVGLKCNSSAIILFHNHPGGKALPSVQDDELTKKIKKFGSYIDLQLTDHFIVTEDSYYSYATEGKL